jgi:hypothetical protein
MIQDQLVAASNNRCNAYKTHLRRLSSNTGFVLGGLATVAGAAGAVVTGGASQALAGAAAALSGVNAQFQQEFFNGLITAVIIPGIDRQRADIRNDIVAKTCQSVSDYPLTMAIAEAVRYHGACTADVGIAASGQAIARTSPDSLGSAAAAAVQVQRIRRTFSSLLPADVQRLKRREAEAGVRANQADQALQRAQKDLDEVPPQASQADIQRLTQRVAQARREANAQAQAWAGLKAEVAAAEANIADLKSDPVGKPEFWKDPSQEPLVGAKTVAVNCGILDQYGLVALKPDGTRARP